MKFFHHVRNDSTEIHVYGQWVLFLWGYRYPDHKLVTDFDFVQLPLTHKNMYLC